MMTATNLAADATEFSPALSVSGQIELFLSGTTDGEALFAALYGDVVDEPVPERLSSLCRTV
jgi:hypothetical protein